MSNMEESVEPEAPIVDDTVIAAELTTDQPIDLEQLTAELGGVGLAAVEVEGETTIRCYDESLTQADLDAAVAAHTPVDTAGNEATLQAQAEAALAANKSWLASGPFTSAGSLAQVKALTRQQNALIRLLLRRFDGTD